MSEKRGKMHDWYLADVWGETMPRCRACGLLGDKMTTFTSDSAGWRGSPIYGCAPPTEKTHE